MLCVHACVRAFVPGVCVCVCERERERERGEGHITEESAFLVVACELQNIYEHIYEFPMKKCIWLPFDAVFTSGKFRTNFDNPKSWGWAGLNFKHGRWEGFPAVFFFISFFCFPTTASLSSLVLKVVGYLLEVSPTKDFHSQIGILKKCFTLPVSIWVMLKI